MEQKILEKLKLAQVKFGKDVTDITLATQASVLSALILDDTMLEKFDAEKVVKDIQGNINFTTGNAVKEEQKKHQTPPTPPIPPTPDDDNKPKDEMTADEIAKIVAEAMKPLQEKLNGYDTANKTKSLVEQAKQAIKTKYGEFKGQDAKMSQKALDIVLKLNPNPEKMEDIVASFESEFEDFRTSVGFSSLTPIDDKKSGGDKKPVTGLSFKEKMIKEGKLPKEE